MVRLVLLLGVGLFAAMLIGGQDRGQLRFGLMPSTDQPVAAVVVVPALAEPAPLAETVSPKPTPIEIVSFAPAEPVMAAVSPVTDAAAQPETQPPEAAKILFIAAKSVNVREGPGTEFGVVSRLGRGEAVLVVSSGEGPDGWSLIRIEGDGIEGYVASRFLAE